MAPPRKIYQAIGATPQSACDAIGATSTSDVAALGLASGTYTPTLAIRSGVGLTLDQPTTPWTYSKVGRVVTVSGSSHVVSTIGSGDVQITATLPVPGTAAGFSGVGCCLSPGTTPPINPSTILVGNLGSGEIALVTMTLIAIVGSATFLYSFQYTI